MRRLRFWLNSILLLAPILVLGTGATRLVRGVFHFLNTDKRLAGTISAEATRALGRLVRVGDVKITGNLWSLDAANRIDLIDVFVANDPAPTSGAFVRARRITVWYNLQQLLASDRPRTPLVDEIGVDGPSMLVQRSRSGRWNYQDFLRPASTTARSFTDKLSFTNGALAYADDAFPHPAGVPDRPLYTRLTHLQGIVLIRTDKSYAFNVSGSADPAYLRDFHVRGTVLPLPLRVQSQLTVTEAALPAIADRLVPPGQVRITAGHANVDAGILYAPPIGTPARFLDIRALFAHGTIQLFDASATGKQIYAPVEHLNGLATFTTDTVLGSVTGLYAGMPVQLDGAVLGMTLPPMGGGRAVVRPTAAPTVSIRGAIQHADWGKIYRLGFVPPLINRLPQDVRQDLRHGTLKGDFQFQAAGPVDNLEAAVTGRVAAAEYKGYRGENMDLRGIYTNHVLHASIKGRFAGGDAVVSGNVALDPVGSFEAQAQGRGLDLARIAMPDNIKITGRGQIDIALRGRKGRTPSITAQAETYNLTVNGQTLQHMVARADTSGPDLVVRTLSAEDPKGFVVASGTLGLKSRRLNMIVDGDELDFRAIARAVFPTEAKSKVEPAAPNRVVSDVAGRLAGLSGFGYARTRLTGNLDDPSLEGALYAFGIQTGAAKLDKVTLSDFKLSRRELRVHGIASRYPGQIRVDGSVLEPFSQTPELNLDTRITDLDLTTLMQLTGVERKDVLLTGTLSTDTIVVRGSLSSPQTPDFFNVNLQNAAVNGVPVRNAAVTMRYQSDGIYVKGASAQVADGLVVGSGWLPFDGPLNVTIHGGGLALQTIGEAALVSAKPDQAPIIFRGDVDFDAAITGSLKQPIVTAQSIRSDNLVYNGFQLGSLKASGDYQDQRVRIGSLALTIPPRIAPEQAQPGKGAIVAKAFRMLAPFLPLGIPPEPKDGTITIVGLTYNLDSKQIRTEPGQPVRFDSIPLERLHDLAYNLIDYNNGDARNVLDDLHELTGPISATAALGGTLDEPQVDVTWNSTQIRARNYEISLFSGSAFVDKNHIVYPSPRTPALKFRIASPYVDVLSPADPQTSNIVVGFDQPGKPGLITTIPNPGVKDGAAVRADLSVSNINLAFLQQILDRAGVSRLEGLADFDIAATGRTTSPELEFTADSRNVAIYSAIGPKAPVVLDHIELLQGSVKEGSIRIGSLRAINRDSATGTPHETTASATLTGFTYEPPFLPPAALLHIEGTLPVGFVAAAAPGLLRDTSTGKIDLTADVRSLRDNPEVRGEINLDVPRLQFTSTATGVQNLVAKLNLDNDRLTIANFSAHTYIYGKPAAVPDEVPSAGARRPSSAKGRAAAPVLENDPKRRGSEIRLTGSLPFGIFNDHTTGPGDGIVVRIFDPSEAAAGQPPVSANARSGRSAPVKQSALTFNEDPLPGSKTGVLRGSVRTDPSRPLRILGSVKEPVLAGRLTFYNAFLTPPAEQKPGAFALPILPSFDLALELGSNVRLHTPQLDARLSTDRDIVAHGRLLDRNSDLSLEGTVQISDGKLRLPTGTFAILPGAFLRVNYPSYEGTDPVLGLTVDLQARGSVVAMSQSGTRKRYQVTVTARGPLTGDTVDPFTGRQTLALTFETNPNDLASTQQLLAERLAGAIIGVDSLDQAGRNPGQAFANVLSGVFTGSVLPGIFDRTAASLGFEELAIGYDPIDRLTLNVSRHIFGPLYVSYYRTLTATQERYDLKLSFRFRDRYQISFDLDEQHTQKLLLEGVWKF